tara:strand:- start:8 stop:217 length:210 start_codon:yes stop_codon:yes gene_type:complete
MTATAILQLPITAVDADAFFASQLNRLMKGNAENEQTKLVPKSPLNRRSLLVNGIILSLCMMLSPESRY